MQAESFLRFYTAYRDVKTQAQAAEERQLQAASSAEEQSTVFRIDKFIVPKGALSQFTEKMRHFQRTLRTLPGCKRALTLSQTGGTGAFNVVTLAEWASNEAISAAAATLQKQFAEEDFDPLTFRQKLGIQGDSGFYGIG
jgi:hypothetical protein